MAITIIFATYHFLMTKGDDRYETHGLVAGLSKVLDE